MTQPNDSAPHRRNCAVILATNGAYYRKGFVTAWDMLHGKPLVAHAVAAFEAAPEIDKIVVVVAPAKRSTAQELAQSQGWCKIHAIAAGRLRRRNAVVAGILATPRNTDLLVIHDATRPLVSQTLIAAALQAAQTSDAVSAAVPLKETLKRVDDQGIIQETPDRSALCTLQTPQIFWRTLLLAAHTTIDPAIDAPDDAWLVQQMGHSVTLFAGEYGNLRITSPEDLAVAEAMLTE